MDSTAAGDGTVVLYECASRRLQVLIALLMTALVTEATGSESDVLCTACSTISSATVVASPGGVLGRADPATGDASCAPMERGGGSGMPLPSEYTIRG